MDVLAGIYRPMTRQGPGSDAMSIRALEIAGLDQRSGFRVADIGCGTGAASILLAERCDAEVVAVDIFESFLEGVQEGGREVGVADRISTLAASMDDLPFDAEEFDVIWSEGAAYNMGFAEAARYWRQFLRPGGTLVVSEITWTTAERPREIEDFWVGEYPQIALPSAKIEVLEQSGYRPEGFFMLPDHCWTQNFYEPLEERLSSVERVNGTDPVVAEVVAAHRYELDLYRRFGQYYSYGMFVARRT